LTVAQRRALFEPTQKQNKKPITTTTVTISLTKTTPATITSKTPTTVTNKATEKSEAVIKTPPRPTPSSVSTPRFQRSARRKTGLSVGITTSNDIHEQIRSLFNFAPRVKNVVLKKKSSKKLKKNEQMPENSTKDTVVIRSPFDKYNNSGTIIILKCCFWFMLNILNQILIKSLILMPTRK
jgi:hypothetical protein